MKGVSNSTQPPAMISEAVRKARQANSLIFLVCGLAVASWAPLIPLAKARLGLGDAALGLLLLLFGAGAIISMPLTGSLINKLGVKKVILYSSIILAAALPLLLNINSIVLMAICLFTFGAATGCIEVAMNAQAVLIQNQYDRYIMSFFHGLFSTGAILGSIGFGLLINAGISPNKSILCISILLIAITLSQYNKLLKNENREKEDSKFILPKGPILVLGLMAFLIALAEGSMLDWSAVLLKYNRHIASSFAGVGLAMFSVAMAFMRLMGDRIVQHIGPSRVVLFGCILTSAGLLIAVSIPFVTAALIGFVMIGLGCANIMPVFFSSASKIENSSGQHALSAVITMGYAGILAGPAIIGFIAQLSSLPFALGILAVFVMIVAIAFKEKK